MALRLQSRVWQQRVALCVLAAVAVSAIFLMDSVLPRASQLSSTAVGSATGHAVDETAKKDTRAAGGWFDNGSGTSAAPAAGVTSAPAVRQVACWRLRGRPAGDDAGDVRCSAEATDSTVQTPPDVLDARLSRSHTGGGDALLAPYAPPNVDYTFVACYAVRSIAGGGGGGSTSRVAPASLPAARVTVASCARACHDAGHAYAVLVGDNGCLCETQRSTARMLPDRNCQQPCAGDRSALCGGTGGAAAIYHLRSADGSAEWTAWMTPWGDGGSSSGSAAVRFRRCPALRGGGRDGDAHDGGEQRCSAELERRPDAAGSPPQPPEMRHFVGCYAVATDPQSAQAALPNATRITEGCLRSCEERGFAYAFLRLADGCSCSQTLGVSRPIAFCDGVYGIPFYAVRAPPDKTKEEEEEHEMEGDDDDNASKEMRDSSTDNLLPVAAAIEGSDGGAEYFERDRQDKNEKGKNVSCDAKNSKFADGNETAGDEMHKKDDRKDGDDHADDCDSGSQHYGGGGKEDARGDGRRAAIELVFDRPPSDKRRVLLLAYHRSGSTFASELVSKHPGALYIFEPDVIYSHLRFALGEYDDIEQLHREFYRAFDRFLRCDVHRLPLIWMALSSFFPRPFEHSPRMAAYIGCLRAHGPAACAPYFQAQCEAASIVSAKTIRLTATPQTAAFVHAHPSLVLLHLMRDPRAVLSSRKLVGASSANGVRDLCSDMQSTAQFVSEPEQLLVPPSGFAAGAVGNARGSGKKRLFNVYYEDLVLKPLQSARHIYAAMFRLNISEATVWRLRVITGEVSDKGPRLRLNRRYTTRKGDPELSLHKWRSQLSAEELATIETQCADVLSWYPPTEGSQKQTEKELYSDYKLVNS